MTDPADRDIDREIVLTVRFETCVDFANTLTYRGSSPAESLNSRADLLKWCEEASVLPSATAPKVLAWFERHPKRASEFFHEAIALRELIYRMLRAVASGAKPDDDDLALFNRALRDAPPRNKLLRSNGDLGWRIEEARPSVSMTLAAVLWSTADLLVSPMRSRLRECSNDKCLWLFLDDSKNGTRRWCSMQSCGNRAKAQRHYLKKKSG